MVVSFYVLFYGHAGQGADERHKGLEGSEEEGDAKGVAYAEFFVCGAADDGDGEGVHCQAESYDCDGDELHLLFCCFVSK